MIDKRVLSLDYCGIRKGMLVLPRSTRGMGAIPTATVWVGPPTSPGLVLELFPHHNESTGALTPTALLLIGGRRVQVGVRWLVPVTDDETTEER